VKSQLSSSSFGAITKFALPGSGRFPNGIAIAGDGSVWFGEQGVPGVAHLFANGTLLEYAWTENYSAPTGGNPCQWKTSIWGVAIWNGKIWATDGDHNQLFGLDPLTASVQSIRMPENGSFPNTLAVGSDGDLWVTFISSPPRLGRLDIQGSLKEFPIAFDKKELPTEVIFVNNTVAYFSALDPFSTNASLYEFNPSTVTSTIVAKQVGKGFHLLAPTSLTLENGTIWMTQHGASSLVSFDLRSQSWKTYPTSLVNYVNWTLPYFVRTASNLVWFNEHYADKIGSLDPAHSQLTEFSLSNPAAKNGREIGNALTLSAGPGKTWFTEWTANYVGYIDQAYQPAFSVSSVGNRTLVVPVGTQTHFAVGLAGQSSKPLFLQFSDSESYSSKPQNISLVANSMVISALNGNNTISVTVEIKNDLRPGNYVVLVTVTDGLIFRSTYFDVVVVA
jgi:streptogramin lyase